MSDMRRLIESVERLMEADNFDAERIIQSNGRLTNVNINRDLPHKFYTGLTGTNYGRDDIVKIYYADDSRLEAWLADNQRAREVDPDNPSVGSDDADRRVPQMGNWGFRADHSAINRIFDSKVRAVGRDPSLEDIRNKFRELRSELEDGSHDVSREYSERQYLGAVAKQIRVDGLFNSNNRTITMSEKDDSGNYKQARGASERLARALADRGLLPEEAAENIGFLGGLAGGLGYSDEDRAQNAGVNASRQGQQRMRTQARRFLELLAKRNQGTTVSDGITYISSLARLLTEALTDAEETEFQELLLIFKDETALSDELDDQTKRLIQQARDAAKDIEPQSGDSGDDLGNAPTTGVDGPADAAAAQQGTDGAADAAAAAEPTASQEGMTLQQFAQSGKGGIKNDPGETRAITELQEFLKTMGWDIGVDGRYGPQTTSAVKEFQQLVGLSDDGDAGPETIAKILVWGRLPDVKTWSAQLKELQSLIEKGAVFSTGSSTQQTPAAQQGINSSKDFRNLISIVESMLKEAVSETEQARAMELYNALKAKIDDGEYQSQLPQELQDQFKAVGDWTRAAPNVDQEGGVANGVDAADAAADVNSLDAAAKAAAIYRGLDGAGTDEESVVAVMGSIRNAQELAAVERVFLQLSGGTALKDWLDSDTSDWFDSEDTQTQVNDIYNRLTGGSENEDPGSLEAITNATQAATGLHEAMKGGWLFGLGTEEQAVLGILGKISTPSWANVQQIYKNQFQNDLLDDLSREFGGADLDNLNTSLSRFNVEITGPGQWGEPSTSSTSSTGPAGQNQTTAPQSISDLGVMP